MPAVVRTGDRGNDCESESTAARGPVATLVGSIGALEDAPDFARWDSGTMISDRDSNACPRGTTGVLD